VCDTQRCAEGASGLLHPLRDGASVNSPHERAGQWEGLEAKCGSSHDSKGSHDRKEGRLQNECLASSCLHAGDRL
jgi:hypothetical protein